MDAVTPLVNVANASNVALQTAKNDRATAQTRLTNAETRITNALLPAVLNNALVVQARIRQATQEVGNAIAANPMFREFVTGVMAPVMTELNAMGQPMTDVIDQINQYTQRIAAPVAPAAAPGPAALVAPAAAPAPAALVAPAAAPAPAALVAPAAPVAREEPRGGAGDGGAAAGGRADNTSGGVRRRARDEDDSGSSKRSRPDECLCSECRRRPGDGAGN